MDPIGFITLLVIAIIILIVVFLALKAAKYLIVHAILGVIVLFIARLVGIGVAIDWKTVIICAIGGIPGAILIIILHFLGVTL